MKQEIIAVFDEYPDIVEVELLCKMLGGISKKLAYRLLAENPQCADRSQLQDPEGLHH